MTTKESKLAVSQFLMTIPAARLDDLIERAQEHTMSYYLPEACLLDVAAGGDIQGYLAFQETKVGATAERAYNLMAFNRSGLCYSQKNRDLRLIPLVQAEIARRAVSPPPPSLITRLTTWLSTQPNRLMSQLNTSKLTLKENQ